MYIFVYVAHGHITDSPAGHRPSLGMFQCGGSVCSFGEGKAETAQVEINKLDTLWLQVSHTLWVRPGVGDGDWSLCRTSSSKA